MAYTALYRKLRPKNFDEIVGQEHIVKVLTNALENNRVSHAYLFTGTRGTGKTTTAKILSKALNCENPEGVNPCNICDTCISIDNDININISEIDAASNNSVDDIRQIREEVKYPPTEAKVKVYIIDEVHMLSNSAFNALLKTLEEPPEKVVFILATTDPQKIPATVLSRCQRLDFHRITTKDIADALSGYMIEEKVDIEEQALNYIARIADGSMRDALSLLDQCIAYYYGETIDIDKVLNITGSVDTKVFSDLLEALVDFNSIKAIEIIETIINNGKDIHQFISDFIVYLRNLLISMSTKTNTLDMSNESFNELKKQGANIDKNIIINYINNFSTLQSNIRYSENPRILLETECIRLTNPERDPDNKNILLRLEKLEQMEFPEIKYINSPDGNKEVEIEKKTKKKLDKIVPKDFEYIKSTWNNFVNNIKGDIPLRSFIKDTNIGYIDGIDLYIVTNNELIAESLNKKKDIIIELIENEYTVSFNLNILDTQSYNLLHHNKYGVEDEELQTNYDDVINIFSEDAVEFK